MTFAKHDRVKWKLKDGSIGRGQTVAAEMDDKVLVAVDPKPASALTQEAAEHHQVIYCATSWLTHDEDAEKEEAKSA